MTSASTLFRLWQQRARERRVAAQFTDRELWYLAFTRGDVARGFAQPFWRAAAAPALWRVRPASRADVIISGDPATASAEM
jgi:uncharacterized protein YjiS (DUF1127 family)